MNFEKNYKLEVGRYNRHENFVKYMLSKKDETNVDWDIYWSYYYHSNLNEERAFEEAKI